MFSLVKCVLVVRPYFVFRAKKRQATYVWTRDQIKPTIHGADGSHCFIDGLRHPVWMKYHIAWKAIGAPDEKTPLLSRFWLCAGVAFTDYGRDVEPLVEAGFSWHQITTVVSCCIWVDAMFLGRLICCIPRKRLLWLVDDVTWPIVGTNRRFRLYIVQP